MDIEYDDEEIDNDENMYGEEMMNEEMDDSFLASFIKLSVFMYFFARSS